VLPAGDLATEILAETSTCDAHEDIEGYFASNKQGNGPTGSVYGVRAVINTTISTFRPCGPDQVDRSFGTSAWVAILPATVGPGILQFGLTNCQDDTKAVCTEDWPDPDVLAVFWEIGGCQQGGSQVAHLVFWMNDDQHDFQIRHVSAGGSRYRFYIGNEMATYDEVPVTHPAVSCWLGSQHIAGSSAETWDNGDGIADPDAKVIFSSVGWRATDSGAWQAPTWNGADDCFRSDTTARLYLYCNLSNVYQTQFYTWSEQKF
jgi:hypothetical protein